MTSQSEPASLPPFDSADYWERRYVAGKTSGKGSYGLLGQYKADVINAFVREHGINTVVEHGCGDGYQASLFEIPSYVGFDVSPKAVEISRQRNQGRSNFSFFHVSDAPLSERSYDLALSLDVIFHLVEDEVFQGYMEVLTNSASRHLIIYCTNYDLPSDAAHMRHRNFANWIAAQAPDWILDRVLQNPYAAPDTPKESRSKAHFHFFSRRA